MFALGIKHALTFLIPKLVMDGYEYIKDALDDKESIEPLVKVRKPRKKSDTTKITQYMFDFIVTEYESWKASEFKRLHNGILCYTHDEFCRILNYELGLNKSRSTLAKVYYGQVKRDSLPLGQPIGKNIGAGSGG